MKFHIFLVELKRTMNIGMIIAVLGVMFSVIFDSWNDLMRALQGNIGSVFYFFSNSAMGGVSRSYFLPIFAALPFATSLCREQVENMFPFIVAREGKKGYSVTKYLVNALSGGFVVALGIAILFLLLSFRFPISEISYSGSLMEDPFHMWLAEHNSTGYGLVEIANGFLAGTLWSSVALLVSAYIPNPFVILASPYLGSLVLVHIFRLFRVDAQYRLDKWLSGYSILGSSIQTLLISFVTVFILISILGILFTKRVGRRIENELRD